MGKLGDAYNKLGHEITMGNQTREIKSRLYKVLQHWNWVSNST